MFRRLTAAVLIALTLTACTATSRSSRCTGGVCTITLSGEQRVEVEFGRLERDLRVGPIEPAAVTVSARGDAARLAPGESATIAGLLVRVDTVAGQDVALQVQPA